MRAAARPRRDGDRILVGRRYSRFVALSKRLLPAVAVTVLLLVAIWPRIEGTLTTLRLPLPRLDVSGARDLQMVAARYAGVDRDNNPFVVTADIARQKPKLNDLVTLERPKGDLTTAGGNGSWLELSADTGFYQPQPQLLDLYGNVALFQDKGNEFHSSSAHLNMAASTAEGDAPVSGKGPFGTVKAQGFRIIDRGATIIFTGHATLEIEPHAGETP